MPDAIPNQQVQGKTVSTPEEAAKYVESQSAVFYRDPAGVVRIAPFGASMENLPPGSKVISGEEAAKYRSDTRYPSTIPDIISKMNVEKENREQQIKQGLLPYWAKEKGMNVAQFERQYGPVEKFDNFGVPSQPNAPKYIAPPTTVEQYGAMQSKSAEVFAAERLRLEQIKESYEKTGQTEAAAKVGEQLKNLGWTELRNFAVSSDSSGLTLVSKQQVSLAIPLIEKSEAVKAKAEELKGDWRLPLMNPYTALALNLGYSVDTAVNALTGKPPPESPVNKLAQFEAERLYEYQGQTAPLLLTTESASIPLITIPITTTLSVVSAAGGIGKAALSTVASKAILYAGTAGVFTAFEAPRALPVLTGTGTIGEKIGFVAGEIGRISYGISTGYVVSSYLSKPSTKYETREISQFEDAKVKISPEYPELAGITSKIKTTREITYPLTRAERIAVALHLAKPQTTTQTFTGNFEGYAIINEEKPQAIIVGKTIIGGKEAAFYGVRELTWERPITLGDVQVTKYGFIESTSTSKSAGSGGVGKIMTVESTEPFVTETTYRFSDIAASKRAGFPDAIFSERRIGQFKIIQEPQKQITYEFNPSAKTTPPPEKTTPSLSLEEQAFIKAFPKSAVAQNILAETKTTESAIPSGESTLTKVINKMPATTITPKFAALSSSAMSASASAISQQVTIPKYQPSFSPKASLLLPFKSEEKVMLKTNTLQRESGKEITRQSLFTIPAFGQMQKPAQTTTITTTITAEKTEFKSPTQNVFPLIYTPAPKTQSVSYPNFYSPPSSYEKGKPSTRMRFKMSKTRKKSILEGKNKEIYGIFSEAISKFKFGKATMGKGVKQMGFYTPTAQTAKARISPSSFLFKGGFIAQKGKGEVSLMQKFRR